MQDTILAVIRNSDLRRLTTHLISWASLLNNSGAIWVCNLGLVESSMSATVCAAEKTSVLVCIADLDLDLHNRLLFCRL